MSSRFLLAVPAVLFSAWSLPAVAAETIPPFPNQQKMLMLADFEQATKDSLAKEWSSLTDRQPSQAFALRIEPEGQQGNPTKSLQLSYAMPSGGKKNNGMQTIDAALKLNGVNGQEYDHLTFLLRGDKAAGFNSQVNIRIRRLEDPANGREAIGMVSIGDVKPQWQRVVIPLNQILGINDWSGLTEFSITLYNYFTSVRQGSYEIDDIALIKTGDPGPSANDGVATPAKAAWDQAHGGGMSTRVALKDRLAAWPKQALIDPKTLPADDPGFLRRLALDTWRGLDGLADKEHGLPLDRVHFGEGSTRLEDAYIGDYTSVTNIGFHIMSIVSALELKFITREEALSRLNATLSSLEHMETYQGFFYNYYNTVTLERTSNFISFVDSGWLTAGLIVGRSAFPELKERFTRLINQGDYRFFYDPQRKLMAHGFFVNLKTRPPFHYGSLYTEARLPSLIAIGKGDAPEELWFNLARIFPKEQEDPARQAVNVKEKTAKGFHWTGGYYLWRGFKFVPSWGGSMFEALMPALVLDEMRYAPDSLGKNDEIHTEVQRRFALEDLAYPVWGMSPSSVPGLDSYAEYGVPMLGSQGYPPGAVTPHAAALALLTEPEQAGQNLRQLAQRFAIYGDFGMYDAVDPKSGKVAYKYLCLDQSMLLLALANHLADHAVQKHFAADPITQRVLPLVGLEKFFD